LSSVVVVKLTGKLFDDSAKLKNYVELFRKLVEKYKFAIIVGGGNRAREAINLAKSVGVSSNYWLDVIGIAASQLNAYILIAGLTPHAYHKPVESLAELLQAVKTSSVAVIGGLIPGQSTAAVAVEVAEALGVDTVIDLAVVDYVYDKDPVKHPDAKMYKEIPASQLKRLLEQSILPGEYALIDVRALEMAMRSGIKIYIAHYKNPENLVKILSGENPGTVIYPF